MTAKLIATIQNYQGLSTDTKPTAPPEGSTYHVIDTGEEYVFYDGTWEPDLRRIAALRAV
jgi:hypothetical protein